MAFHPSHISHEVPDWIALPQNPELALHNIFYTRNPRLWLLIILGSRIGGNGYRVIHANCRALYTRFDVD